MIIIDSWFLFYFIGLIVLNRVYIIDKDKRVRKFN